MTRFLALATFLTSTALLGGCGGGGGSGGGGGGGPVPITIDLALDPLNSGLTTNTGAVGPAVNYVPGDTGNNTEVRAQFTFQLGQIPANATITLAQLRCTQLQVNGNPYGEIGTLDVDHIDQGIGLDAADHASAALTANVGALSSDATLGLKVLVVTAQVQADFGVRPDSNFRLRFTTAPSVDGNPDSAVLGIVAPGDELALRVTYTVP